MLIGGAGQGATALRSCLKILFGNGDLMMMPFICSYRNKNALALAGFHGGGGCGLGLGEGGLGGPRAGVDVLWRLCCGVAVGGPFAVGRP